MHARLTHQTGLVSAQDACMHERVTHQEDVVVDRLWDADDGADDSPVGAPFLDGICPSIAAIAANDKKHADAQQVDLLHDLAAQHTAGDVAI